jgi:hypothetical protein
MTKSIRGSHLINGRIRSCGCLYNQRTRSKVGKTKIIIKDDYCVGITDIDDIFYFDIIDIQIVESHNWYLDYDGYVATRINGKSQKLHKLIMNKQNTIIHHKNKQEYDNRRCNLEYVTNSENGLTTKIRSDNKSGVTGVGWHSKYGKWRARIIINGKENFLEFFNNKEDAIFARKEAERKYIRNELLKYDYVD